MREKRRLGAPRPASRASRPLSANQPRETWPSGAERPDHCTNFRVSQERPRCFCELLEAALSSREETAIAVKWAGDAAPRPVWKERIAVAVITTEEYCCSALSFSPGDDSRVRPRERGSDCVGVGSYKLPEKSWV